MGETRRWQLFPTNVITKPLHALFSQSSSSAASGGSATSKGNCLVCIEFARIVLQKYHEFDVGFRSSVGDHRRAVRQDEVNNAFFAWQLTNEQEQESEHGHQHWPELYHDSKEFVELKHLVRVVGAASLQSIHGSSLPSIPAENLEVSIWASVTPPSLTGGARPGEMSLDFHDHPFALLSGVFYVQAGGHRIGERTPIIFADPRGTPAFRYARQSARRGDITVEDLMTPTAPFHRLAYAHALDGHAVFFPSWLVHGVPPHTGSSHRVAFAFNIHAAEGTVLSSWSQTTV